MSVVVGVIAAHGPAIYGDALTSTGMPYRTDVDPKIFAGRGCLYGIAGGAAACERLATAFHDAFFQGSTLRPDRQDIVRVLLEVEHAQEAEFLFLTRSQIFYGCGDGTLTTIRGDFAAIGCGGAFATGYLECHRALGHDPTSDKYVREAMEASFVAYPDSCGGRVDRLALSSLDLPRKASPEVSTNGSNGSNGSNGRGLLDTPEVAMPIGRR